MKVFDQTITDSYAMYHCDSMEMLKGIPTGSIDHIVTSIPFGDQYFYSDSTRCFGNVDSDDHFCEGYQFMAEALYRVMRPGRICAIHCKQRQQYKSRTGRTCLRDFRGDIIRVHEAAGWAYHSEVTIWKDPVLERARNQTQRLLHCQVASDSTLSGTGQAEYLVLFRKWPEAGDEIVPVTRNDGEVRFTSYAGEDAPAMPVQAGKGGRNIASVNSINIWQRIASPVWSDIRQTRVLKPDPEKGPDERHICALQLDVIERSIELYSNPGEVVLDPYAGIGSSGYQAILQKRLFIGGELKDSYYEQAIRNLNMAVFKMSQPSLFGADDYEYQENVA